MEFSGFTNEDFDVFFIDGLENRMNAIKEKIRPKLESLGCNYAPSLSALTGDEIFAHVAKHARRTKNPPNDTWVAFANNPRGYKMLPHFQIGLWSTHLFIWFAIINESPFKQDYGKEFEKKLEKIYDIIPGNFSWSVDHTKTDTFQHRDLSKQQLKSFFQNLQTMKKAEILCGLEIDRQTAVNMNTSDIEKTIDEVFNKLTCLYKLIR